MPATRSFRLIAFALFAIFFTLAMSKVAGAQTQDPAQLEAGAILFAENCAVCHGADGQGRVGATLAQDWPSVRPDLTVRTTIERGIEGSVMPAWSQQYGGPLTGEQIDALVAFILSWQTGGPSNLPILPTATPHPPITPIPQVQGDPNHGAVLFGENCAVCHGAQGEGRVGATLAKDWSGIRPDLNIKTTITNGIPGSVMPAWSKANGGPLDEAQINDLVAFILSRPGNSVIQVAPGQTAQAPSVIGWLRGPGGLILAVLIFIVIIAGALILQRK